MNHDDPTIANWWPAHNGQGDETLLINEPLTPYRIDPEEFDRDTIAPEPQPVHKDPELLLMIGFAMIIALCAGFLLGEWLYHLLPVV